MFGYACLDVVADVFNFWCILYLYRPLRHTDAIEWLIKLESNTRASSRANKNTAKTILANQKCKRNMKILVTTE